ncbi:MAG TPA: OmpA family protein [Thiobacillaceae bacterium]|nr:OmpA family protein [Thiobacillaceae bacterium]HNU63842.1 OmpA family protein [Thiobacillaceae bacterium]
MRFKPLSLLVLLTMGGVAQAAERYYDPSNAASNTGKTTGYELYKTIGCPGRGLLDAPCPGDVAAKPAPAAASRAMDSDGDGVLDGQDRCPDTPRGARVDATGCEPDSDGDGVVDRLDQCPDTPAGRKVDAHGCELDSDGDGVVDALDKCPDSPAGARVDANGCEPDSDGDGVVDRLDQCPDTPAGRKVDARGCELDGDGDGVVDALDECPATPAGDKVDARGCSLPKVIVLPGVHFDNDQDALRPDAVAILNEVVATLKANPRVKVEIAGHTDSRNTDWYNLGLGERRARSVLHYLTSQGIDAARLTAKSYGESMPIADNETEAGRMRNRRVELKLLN